MGDYRAAAQEYVEGLVSTPDVTLTRLQGTAKYGFGANLEQDFSHGVRSYARWGWNEPHKELFAYTEVNETFTGAPTSRAAYWHRKIDRFGAAFVSNGISRDHQGYLALGGTGFLLGDGGSDLRAREYRGALLHRPCVARAVLSAGTCSTS